MSSCLHENTLRLNVDILGTNELRNGTYCNKDENKIALLGEECRQYFCQAIMEVTPQGKELGHQCEADLFSPLSFLLYYPSIINTFLLVISLSTLRNSHYHQLETSLLSPTEWPQRTMTHSGSGCPALALASSISGTHSSMSMIPRQRNPSSLSPSVAWPFRPC